MSTKVRESLDYRSPKKRKKKEKKEKGSGVARDPAGASEKTLVDVLYLCPNKPHPERDGGPLQ